MVLPNHIEQAERIGMPEDKVEVHRCRQCDAKVIEWNDKCDECKKECCPECWVWIPDIGFKFCCESCARTRLLKLLAAAEMNDKPITEHPDVQRLIGQVVGLQAENAEIRNQWHIDLNDKTELQAENKLIREEMNTRNMASARALDELWAKIILKKSPGYGDWEYPMQAMRHILCEFEELQAENKRLRSVIHDVIILTEETSTKEFAKQALKGE